MRLGLVLLLLCFSLHASPPKAVVFDYGGVVAKVDRKPVLEFLSESLNLPYRKVKKDFASDKLYRALKHSRNYWEGYAKKPLSAEWETQLDSQKALIIQNTPGMSELIETIKAQGIQVALLSNTHRHRARFIENMGGYDLFDPILLSCYLGEKKPSEEVFTHLLNHLKWKPEECLFIDNCKSNVKSAQKMGIDSIRFESIEQLKLELQKREIIL